MLFLSKLFLTVLLTAFFSNVHAKRCSICDIPRLITINPPTLFDPTPLGYSHISVDTKNLIATVAGQVALNKTGDIVGSTFEEQLVVVGENLRFALEAVDADVEDIFKLNIYIVNYNSSTDVPIFTSALMGSGSAPGVLIPVSALAFEGLLVEIEISVAVSKRFVLKKACKQVRKPSFMGKKACD